MIKYHCARARRARIISCCCAAFSSSAQVFNFGIIYGRNLSRFSCAFCARAKLFPRRAARWMTYFLHARARAQGAARSHRLVLVKRIRFIARLYKLEALVGITHHSGVTTAGKNRGSEKERRRAAPETHTHQMNCNCSFLLWATRKLLKHPLAAAARKRDIILLLATQLNYFLQTEREWNFSLALEPTHSCREWGPKVVRLISLVFSETVCNLFLA